MRIARGRFRPQPHGRVRVQRRRSACAARACVHQFGGAAASTARRSTRLMCTPDGGTIDDLIVYRLDAERYMLCVNASNIDADREWLLELNGRRAGFRDRQRRDRAGRGAGPTGRGDSAGARATRRSPRCARFAVAAGRSRGRPMPRRAHRLHRRGRLRAVRRRDCRRGAFRARSSTPAHRRDAAAAGLGARDTLRLEAGLPLYGHELDRATSPLEAGLDTFVKLGREFVGAAALAAQQRDGLKQQLVGIRTDDGTQRRAPGLQAFRDAREVGVDDERDLCADVSTGRSRWHTWRRRPARRRLGRSRDSQSPGRRYGRGDCRFIAAASRHAANYIVRTKRRSIERDGVRTLPMRFMPHTESDIAAMLETIGATQLDDLIAHVPANLRASAAINLDAGRRTRPKSPPRLRALAARNTGAQRLRELPRRRLLPPLRAGGRARDHRARRVRHQLYAVPGRGEPGHHAGDFRIPDADHAAHRPRGRQRQHVRRRVGRRRGGPDGASGDAQAHASSRCRARCGPTIAPRSALI